MLDYVTGDDIFAQIQMLRTADQRAIVLLESDADCGALDPHITDQTARTLPTWSKTALLRAIALVDQHRVEHVVGLADRDFDGVLFAEAESELVIYTDRYDLDATIILSGDILQRLLSSFADRAKLQAHLKRLGNSSTDVIVNMAGPIGYGRYVSIRDRLEVRFEDFPVNACAEGSEGSTGISALSDVAISRSKQPTCDGVELARRIRAGLKRAGNLQQYCSGHDLAAVIAHLVRTEWGKAKVSRELIEHAARAAFDCESLKSTAFYKHVHEWSTNVGVTVWECA